MQTIVVHNVPVIQVQLGAIIGTSHEPVSASRSDFNSAIPTCTEVITTSPEGAPSPTCIAIGNSRCCPYVMWTKAVQIGHSAVATKKISFFFPTTDFLGPQAP
jgi:hypothetical protein